MFSVRLLLRLMTSTGSIFSKWSASSEIMSTRSLVLDAGVSSISQVLLDYGNSNASEEIDDLIFE